MSLNTPPRIAAICLLLLSATACLKVPQQSASLAAMEQSEVTAGELQMRVYEAGRRFSWIIESTADTIAMRSSDPTIRRMALRWKLVAIPLVEEASLRADPLVAAADLWGFTMQQSDFLRRGAGRDMFGPLQPIAIAAADTVERLAAEVAGRLRADGRIPPDQEEAVRRWAERHPIQGSQWGRESVLSSNWKALALTESSLTGTVASVQRSLIGVTNRLGYLNEGIFKRVLWQSELVARELAPTILEGGRETLVRDLSEQQSQLFKAVDQQRTATLSALTAERVAILDALRRERVAVLAAIRGERTAVLDDIRAERVAAFAAMDSLTRRSIDHAGAVAGRLLRWTLGGILVLTIVVGLGALGIARVWRSAG